MKIEKLGTLCGSGWITLLMLVHVNNYEKYCKKNEKCYVYNAFITITT